MADQDPTLEGADNPERPTWLPDNFKTGEDLARSYTESQRKITEQANQLRGMEESMSQLSQQFESFTAQQNQPDPYQVQSQWQELLEADPVNTIAQIAQATSQQALAQFQQQNQAQQGAVPAEVAAFMADQNLTAQYGDEWAAYKEKVGEVISSDPLFQDDRIWTSPQLATQALEKAYKLVRADDIMSGNTAVQQQLADTRNMKLAAQSAAGASGNHTPAADDKLEWERIKNAAPPQYWEQRG